MPFITIVYIKENKLIKLRYGNKFDILENPEDCYFREGFLPILKPKI